MTQKNLGTSRNGIAILIIVVTVLVARGSYYSVSASSSPMSMSMSMSTTSSRSTMSSMSMASIELQNPTTADYMLQLVLGSFFAIIAVGALTVLIAYPKKPRPQSTSSKNLQ